MTTAPSPPAPLCFVDTETNGLHVGREAWDVALIRRDYAEDGTIATETAVSFFVQLRHKDEAAVDALRVGRYWDRHPEGLAAAGRLPLATPRMPLSIGSRLPPHGGLYNRGLAGLVIARFTHDAHVVGAVPSFDTAPLADLVESAGALPNWHYHLVDVNVLMLGFLAATGKRQLPGWKSTALAAAIGVTPTPPGQVHTALGDALHARRIYDTIMHGAEFPAPATATLAAA